MNDVFVIWVNKGKIDIQNIKIRIPNGVFGFKDNKI